MTEALFDFKVGQGQREQIIPRSFDTPVMGEAAFDPNEELVEDGFVEDAGTGFVMRPYQVEAVRRIEEELHGTAGDKDTPGIEAKSSTLLVLATGLGKTCVAGQAIKQRKPGKIMFVAHRSELIYQAKTTLEALCGEPATVEMADNYARMDANIVVASVQTLISGSGAGRMENFNPYQYSLIVLDECHHAVSDSWSRVVRHFQQNKNLKTLGLTATPDRADEEALGKVFQSVAMTYEISDAIRDGWLVPIRATPVNVAGLDFSTIRTTAGDLNGKDLAEVMEAEGPLHEMTQAIIEVVHQVPPQTLTPALAVPDADFHGEVARLLDGRKLRKTLVFAASVAHAERLCEIINRWLPDTACWVCGETPKDARKQLFADYKTGRYMFLVNVGVATEGFDEPSIEVVVMGRPTKSRSLYTQMAGRGTRALAGVVDGPETPEARKAAIAASGKGYLEIVDFCGVCGKHTLITPADILGGNYTDAEIERAKKDMQENSGKPADVDEALERARKELEAEKAREAATRAKVRVAAKYTIGKGIDVFSLFNIQPAKERGWDNAYPLSAKQAAYLERQNINVEGMPVGQQRQVYNQCLYRIKAGKCSPKQAALLKKRGLPVDVPFKVAGDWITRIAGNSWQVPPDVFAAAKEYRK
jgi:superfamily II DNA or RNA helicase